jgi:nitroimidazol reductase NimA-like FMN-containing flavoprotein (pyridoxamine 5'-phosphate oxidase superfamily)
MKLVGIKAMKKKIISAHPGISGPMTEEEIKNFLANNNNNLLIRIGLIDEKGEPNVIPTGYYFDDMSNKIYITTLHEARKLIT